VVFDSLSRLSRDMKVYQEIKDAAIKAGAPQLRQQNR